MKYGNVVKLVKFLFEVQKKTGKRYVLYLWGASGRGKTALGRRVADELDMRYNNVRLATKPDAGDLVGLLMVEDLYPCAACTNGHVPPERYTAQELRQHVLKAHPDKQYDDVLADVRKHLQAYVERKTIHLPPRDIPLDSNVLTFLDELPRATRAVADACFTLLEDGRVGPHQIPIDSFVLAAGNPPTDKYRGNDMDQERAFMGRAIHIILESDPKDWVEYAFRTGHHPEVIEAVLADSSMFLGNEVVSADFLNEVLEGNERNMSKVSDLLKLGIMDVLGVDDVEEVIAGIIGAKSASTFRDLMTDKNRPLSAAQVLDEFPQHRARFKDFVPEDGTKVNFGKLHFTNHALAQHIRNAVTKDSAFELTAKQAKNLAEYILALPKDAALGFVKMVTAEPACSLVLGKVGVAHPEVRDMMVGVAVEIKSVGKGRGRSK